MNLLTTGNPKVEKSRGYGYYTGVLHLSPFTSGGANLCPMAELAACHVACLNTAGRGGIAKSRATMKTATGATLPDNAIQACRLRRTELFHHDWPAFFEQLCREIAAHAKRAETAGLLPCIRLNGTSDVRFESMRHNGKTIFDMFPGVQFYDYSKIPNRRGLPANYYICLSYSGASPEFASLISDAASRQGRNLVAVFAGALPATYLGRTVVDGDQHDLRFLDPVGVIVGLKAKGRAKRDTSGFVIR